MTSNQADSTCEPAMTRLTRLDNLEVYWETHGHLCVSKRLQANRCVPPIFRHPLSSPFPCLSPLKWVRVYLKLELKKQMNRALV